MNLNPNDFSKEELAMVAEAATMAAAQVQINNKAYADSLSELLNASGPLDKRTVAETATAYINSNSEILTELGHKLDLFMHRPGGTAN